MVRIRLRRLGAKKQPAYRIVVADSRAPRDGRFIEIIGHYNPRTDPPRIVVREDRALYWLSQGAQPSGAVAAFFAKLGLPEKLAQVRAGAAIEEVAAPPAPEVKSPATPRRPARGGKATAAPPATEEAAALLDEATAVPESPVAEPIAPPEEGSLAGGPAVAKATAGIESLGLPPRITKALEAAGVTSVGQLSDLLAAGDQSLLDLPGIGAKALDEIRACLAEDGATKEE